MKLTDEQVEFVKSCIKGKKVDDQKLLNYLENHTEITKEIFEECRSKDDQTIYIPSFHFGKRKKSVFPIARDKFIRWLPFFYYKDDRGYSFSTWLQSLTDEAEFTEDSFENFMEILEYLYYDATIKVEEILKYPRLQLHEPKKREHLDLDYIMSDWSEIKENELIEKWADYIKICKEINWKDYFPERLITRYNEALETIGKEPLIYGYMDSKSEFKMFRENDEISFEWNFPCDGMGRPIMKWIGIRVSDAKNIECSCNKSRFGTLKIKICPDTMISVLTYENKNGEIVHKEDDDAEPVWEEVYAGPRKMVFNSEALKAIRMERKMTQKELADAIGASVRTYQKWENGDTKPDCQNLLRIMNWLEIDNVQYLISNEEGE